MASFVVQCANGQKPVTATSSLGFCVSNWGSQYWVTNGGMCNECFIPIEPAASTIGQSATTHGEECSVICEMAPSPIVPEAIGGFPLSRVHSISVREVARVGRSIVLHAIHDGESIDWQADGGRLHLLASDIAVWTGDGGDEAIVTATAQSAEGLAVASTQLAA
jgi:hypothetical protein